MACSRVTTLIPSRGRIVLSTSEGPGQAEQVLRHIGEDQVGRDGCYLVQPGLAELALDVILVGKPEAAVELKAGVGGLPRGFRREVLGHVGLGSAGLVRIEATARVEAHQVGGFEFDEGFGDRELHALVLADRPPEHDALVDVGNHLVDEPVAVADALSGDQRALAFRPSRMYLKPLPSSPIRFSAGISRLSMNSSLVSWLTMLAIGWTVSPLPMA